MLYPTCAYSVMCVCIHTGQSDVDHTTEDPIWDAQQSVGAFQEAGSGAGLKPVPFQPPLQMQSRTVHTSQPPHVQPIPPGVQGQVVDWQQFEAQMNLMCQQNPMFFQQMQQFFWTQAIAAQQQLQQQPFQQIHSQQFQHMQQAQQVPTAAAANFNRPFGTASEYNVVNFSAPQVLDLPPDQKGSGPPGTQYIGAPPGGLFIPPPMMTHVPHSEETETSQQTPRPRNAIPIVPPKVHI